MSARTPERCGSQPGSPRRFLHPIISVQVNPSTTRRTHAKDLRTRG